MNKAGVVTFLGTGTSQGVPVIGCTCVACTSPDYRDKRLRSSIHIAYAGSSILVDTSPDLRQQALRANLKHVDAVVYTHEHKDHTGGLDDVRPFNFIANKDIPLYGWPRVLDRIQQDYQYAFAKDKYPGTPALTLHEITSDNLVLGGLDFDIFPVWHHYLPVLAFRCGSFAYITDTNHIDIEIQTRLKNIDTLVLDALQPEPHISHFTLDQALKVIEYINPKMAYLTHISHRMGTYIERNRTLPPNVELAHDGQRFSFTPLVSV